MPDWSEEIRRLLAHLDLAPTRERDIVEELAQHADDRFRELRNNGVTDAEARRITLDELSGHELLSKGLRTVERTNVGLLGGLGQDLRYGFRTLRNSPGFTAVAMLALALGIGANSAIFTVVNGILLQPLAYPDAGRLVKIFESSRDFSQGSVSYLNYLDWRRQQFVHRHRGVPKR
jgi:putative ABC transport system permease protein